MMKPEDIKMALECCKNIEDFSGATCAAECPYKGNCDTNETNFLEDIISLIDSLEKKYELAVKERETQYKVYFDTVNELNEAKAENERLSGELIVESTRRKNAVNAFHNAKTEAIKEFAERLIDEIGFNSSLADVYEYIDNLVKEMVKGGEG